MNSCQNAQTQLERMVSEGRVPGIQYSVVNEHGTMFEFNGGWAQTAASIPVTPETVFMSASMTKVVTALAVLQLADRGLLSLDAPLSASFADHPYGDELTVRRLLSHTAGVPNPMPLDWCHGSRHHAQYDETAELDRRLAQSSKLQAPPGREFRYSNLGYWLLSGVIDRAAGMSYEHYVRQQILAPLGIPESDLGFALAGPDRRATGYIKRWSLMRGLLSVAAPSFMMGESRGSWTSFEPVYMNGPAYGGLFGNARGWTVLLADQLAPDSIALGGAAQTEFYRAQRTSNGQKIPMTLGWHIGSLKGKRHFYKAGGGPGFSCNLRIYPDQGLATVWLSNRMAASESPIQAISDSIDANFV